MNVLIIHHEGRAHGSGGVTAMYRLHRGLLAAGVNSTIACRRRDTDAPDIVVLPTANRIENVLGSISWRLGLNDVHCVSTFKIRNFQPFLEADVVNLQGIHTNYFNYLALPSLAKRKPLVFTLHDMWALTGHCSHSHECERWKTGCGRCPHLDVYPPISRDGTAIEWRLKRWAYKHAAMTIVSPSKWLADLARQSMLNHFPIHHIPNGVDPTIYTPLNKNNCRTQLGVPHDRLVIMFAAAALKNPGKGSDLLIDALRMLPQTLKDQSVLLLVGDQGEALRDVVGMDAICLGFITDEQCKVMAYNAADVFVLPSRAENHSLVLLEASACGTPCVAFDVGGNPEIVRHMHTGYLAQHVSSEDLGRGMTHLLSNESHRKHMSDNARAMILSEFTLQQHIDRYIDVYESAIAAFPRTTAVAAFA